MSSIAAPCSRLKVLQYPFESVADYIDNHSVRMTTLKCNQHAPLHVPSDINAPHLADRGAPRQLCGDPRAEKKQASATLTQQSGTGLATTDCFVPGSSVVGKLLRKRHSWL